MSILPFAVLLFVRSDVDLAAAVDARIAGEVGAAVDRRSIAVAHTAGETGAACIDSRGIGCNIKIRRVRSDVVKERIGIWRIRVFAGA